jgi:hypothetical protein
MNKNIEGRLSRADLGCLAPGGGCANTALKSGRLLAERLPC